MIGKQPPNWAERSRILHRVWGLFVASLAYTVVYIRAASAGFGPDNPAMSRPTQEVCGE